MSESTPMTEEVEEEFEEARERLEEMKEKIRPFTGDSGKLIQAESRSEWTSSNQP